MSFRYFAILVAFVVSFLFTELNAINDDSTEIDSLEQILSSVRDTQKIKVLNKLSYYYSTTDLDKTILFAEQAYKLGMQLNYPYGIITSIKNKGVYYNSKRDYDTAIKNYLLLENSYKNYLSTKLLIENANVIANLYRKKANYDSALYYYNNALDLAKEQMDPLSIGSSMTSIGITHYSKGDLDASLKHIEKATPYLERARDTASLAKNYYMYGTIYHQKGDYVKALKSATKSFDLRVKAKLKKDQANSLTQIGAIYVSDNKLNKGLESYQNALEVKKELNEEEGVGELYHNIGGIYQRQNRQEKAIEYYLKAYEIKEKIGEKYNLSTALYSLGTIYLNKKIDIKKGLDFFEKALLVAMDQGSKSEAAQAYLGIGSCHYQLKNYDMALKNLFLALDYYENNKQSYILSYLYVILGTVFLESGEEVKALTYMKQGLVLAEKNNHTSSILENNRSLSSAYRKIGNYKKAYEHYKLYAELQDSLFNKEMNQQLLEMEGKYELEKKQKEIMLLEQEQQEKDLEIANKNIQLINQEKFRNILLAGLIIFILLGLLIYGRYKVTQKHLNFERHMKNVEKELAETNLKNEQLKSKQLEDELAFKHKELTNFGLYIIEKNQFLENLKQEVIKMKDDNAQSITKEILRHINDNLRNEQDKEEFSMQVDQLNEDFLYKLQQRFPDLSEAEKRLCTLLRINLSSKDISTLINITPKSVDMARYRLRKKFNLEAGETLNKFLSKI